MSENAEAERHLIAVIRDAVNASGRSINHIAKESGVSQSSLSRFMSGERLLSLEAASKLFDYLGLTVNPPRQDKPAPKRPARKPKK